jgi:RNA-directed DNA polymerase
MFRRAHHSAHGGHGGRVPCDALCNVVCPIFENGFIDHTFANRSGKGSHKAIEACEYYRDRHAGVLRCDISPPSS